MRFFNEKRCIIQIATHFFKKLWGGGGKSLSRINNNIYIIKVLKGFISNLIK